MRENKMIQSSDETLADIKSKMGIKPSATSDEIIAKIRTRLGIDSTPKKPTYDLEGPNIFERNHLMNRPLILAEYNIGGSENFTSDRYGHISSKYNNDLINYVTIGFGIGTIVLCIYLINRAKSKRKNKKENN